MDITGNLTASGLSVSQLGGTSLLIGGNSKITAKGTGKDINLKNYGNSFGGTPSFDTRRDARITAAGGVALGSVDVDRNLAIHAGGNVTNIAGSVIDVTGEAAIHAASHNVTLGDSAGDSVNFGSLSVTGGAVAVSEDSETVLAGVTADSLSLKSLGTITDTEDADISVTSWGAVFAGNNAVTLGDSVGNDTNFGRLYVQGSAVSIAEDSATELAAVSASGMTLTSNGVITDSGTVQVTDTLTLAAGNANDIVLDTAENRVGTVQVAIGNNVTLVEADGVNLGTFHMDGNLQLTAGGDVTQTGILHVAGTTGVNASGRKVSLDADNRFGGAVSVTGSDVTLADATGFELSDSRITGDLYVDASGIAINGAVEVTGDTRLTSSGTANDIAIGNAGNSFAGTITANSDGDLRVDDISGTVRILDSHAGGDFVNNGKVALAGNLDVDGSLKNNVGASLDAGSGDTTVGGDFENRGNFNAQTGRVILDGVEQKILGSSTFNDLVKKTPGGKLILESGEEQIIGGILVLKGADGNLMEINSTGAASISTTRCR